MKTSISARLDALEHRPQSIIPRLTLEYVDGRREVFAGADVIAHYAGVKRVIFDSEHQPSVDAAALYQALHKDIEVVAQ